MSIIVICKFVVKVISSLQVMFKIFSAVVTFINAVTRHVYKSCIIF